MIYNVQSCVLAYGMHVYIALIVTWLIEPSGTFCFSFMLIMYVAFRHTCVCCSRLTSPQGPWPLGS